MTYTFPPSAPPALPTVSGALFPVRRVFCVGRNYGDHAREMGHDPDREPPFFFTKPADAVVQSGRTLPFPSATTNLHHEAELVVAIDVGGRDIAPDAAMNHVWGFASGNDLTRRDMQTKAKEARRPWDMAKGFDHSAIIGPLHPIETCGAMTRGRITCEVDGMRKQEGDIGEMIWPTADIIAYLSTLIALQAGDLIMTGTPAGVGPILPGQSCTVAIDGLSPATVTFDA